MATKIFISHKDEDAAAAKKIAQRWKTLGQEKVTIFLSEKISSGKNWLKEIETAIKDTDILYLLYTDPDYDWSWCMFEVGAYWQAMNDSPDRERLIVPLFNDLTKKPPPQLERLNGVNVHDKDRMEEHLAKELYPRFNADAAGDAAQVQTDAADICDWLKKEPESSTRELNRHHVYRIRIEHSGSEFVDSDPLPDDAIVTSDQISLYKVFNIQTPDGDTTTWGELRDVAEFGRGPAAAEPSEEDSGAEYEARNYWLEELVERVRAASKKKDPFFETPMRGIYISSQSHMRSRDARAFRPLLLSDTKFPNDVRSYELIFLPEDLFGWDIRTIDEPYASLLTSSLSASRWRFEVLLPFKDSIHKAATNYTGSYSELGRELLHKILDIDSETRIRHMLQKDSLVSNYSGPDQKTVDKMWEPWFTCVNEIRAILESDGGLMRNKVDAVQDQLKKLFEMNTEFMKTIGPQFTNAAGGNGESKNPPRSRSGRFSIMQVRNAFKRSGPGEAKGKPPKTPLTNH